MKTRSQTQKASVMSVEEDSRKTEAGKEKDGEEEVKEKQKEAEKAKDEEERSKGKEKEAEKAKDDEVKLNEETEGKNGKKENEKVRKDKKDRKKGRMDLKELLELPGLQEKLAKVIKDAQGSEESEDSIEEIDSTTPESASRKRKKRVKKKKVREESHSESSDEERTKFTLQPRIKIPTLEKGMTYAKYKINVEMWENAVKGYMNEKDMGLALLQALPDEDNKGGIKEQAWKQLGTKGTNKLSCRQGVKNLLQFLDKKLLKTDFVRCIELNDKHTAIKQQEGWSIDKYIAEAQQIWAQMKDLGCSVPATMKCATLIRGLNLPEMQVHLIASKLRIGATDLEKQTVDAIKAFADTNRVLAKANKSKKNTDEESVNIAEDALGYRLGEGAEKADEVLVAGAHGACHFCNKKGHIKRDCPDNKKRLLKLKEIKEANGEEWLSPKSWEEKKKSQRDKKDQNRDKGTIFFTQATKDNGNTTQLFDKNRIEDESEYDSYVTSCEKNPVQMLVQAAERPSPPHYDKGEDNRYVHTMLKGMDVQGPGEVELLVLEEYRNSIFRYFVNIVSYLK